MCSGVIELFRLVIINSTSTITLLVGYLSLSVMTLVTETTDYLEWQSMRTRSSAVQIVTLAFVYKH